MAGTAGHEVGHDYDLSLKDKKYKTKEEEVLVKIFNMTSKPAYAGTEAKTPEYNLRGSELFQHELGGFIRAKIAKELNNKDVKWGNKNEKNIDNDNIIIELSFRKW